MTLTRRSLLALSAAAALPGCGAVSAVSRASTPLDTFTLSSLGPTGSRAGGAGHIVVEAPSAGGELTTDRVLIKVNPRQAEYLPDARWSEPAPAMVQTLLVNSLLNRGGFGLVSRVGAGLVPDYTLMSELQAFQAEVTGEAGTQVRIQIQMTLIRESDRSIAGTRRFGTSAAVASDSTPTLIAALDGAMQSVLGDVVSWLRSVA
jgi:cholesterol transport system auxiliary component